MNKMGDRIHEKRLEYGLTMEELAEKIGVNKSSISKWEANDVGNIKRSSIQKMAEIFHCRPSWLMGFEDTPQVTVTYNAEGKEPLTALVDTQEPIIGESSKRAQLYKVALEIKPENLDIAIQILKSLL